ncbi:hypothetical protein JXQ70_20480 [bacterium]|nr:hypothetical protein [bacterium]
MSIILTYKSYGITKKKTKRTVVLGDLVWFQPQQQQFFKEIALMKRLTVVVLALFVLSSSSLIALADEPDTQSPQATCQKAETPVEAQVAVYAVPNLTEEVVTKLVDILKENKGIAKARPDFEKKQLIVVFDQKLTDQTKIKESLVIAVPETTLESVRKADEKDLKHDCGKCPSKKTCSKAKN